MTARIRISLIFLAASVFLPPLLATQTPGRILQPDWQQGGVQSAALSASARCAAITTASAVVVVDKTGRELWRWDYSVGNRFIVANKVAVSTQCDWVAFVGGADYRYAWIAERSGQRVPLQTQGTPLAVTMDHSGALAAIGTGAGIIYLYKRDGTLRWKEDVGGPVPVQELAFSEDDKSIFMSSRGQAVIAVDGRTKWSGGVWGVGSARATPDFKAFVAWGEPPHGPGIGVVALLDSAGKEVWRRFATSPRSIISSKGDLVVARTNDNQNPTEADGFIDVDKPSALRLIAADGKIARTYPNPGEPIAFAEDGRRFLIETIDGFSALDLAGNVLWQIPTADQFDNRLLASRDLRTIIVVKNGTLSWFSAP